MKLGTGRCDFGSRPGMQRRLADLQKVTFSMVSQQHAHITPYCDEEKSQTHLFVWRRKTKTHLIAWRRETKTHLIVPSF